MSRTPPTGIRNRRTQVVAILGALVILVSLALPRIIAPDGADDVPDAPLRPQRTGLLRDRVAQTTEAREAEETHAEARQVALTGVRTPRPTAGESPREAERIEVERVQEAADDLEVLVSLRWESYPSGTAIQAQVEIANRDDTPVWIPAPNEPQRTLTIQVLDASGATVRRVTEEAPERLPRRMQRIGPGESAIVKMDVIAHGETPLEPGSYELAAVYESDKAWLRSGLPVWTAPKGARHSGRVTFEVTAR